MYDALLLVSFGGPEGPDDVIPFLENVTRGRNIPRARLEQVGEHYHRFGGISPINSQCRTLKAALEASLDVPVYWGNRNWAPYLADAVQQMKDDGVRRAAAFVTSAYGGYSCCRQYLDDLDRVAVEGLRIDKLRVYYNHPGFVEPFVEATRTALEGLPGDAPLIFTAHSVPLAQPGRERYEAELTDLATTVAAGFGRPWQLVYQSRSGPPAQPWLEPDIRDHLTSLHASGVTAAAIVPIGFVSDHMEVVYDLDVEAADLAAELDMTVVRAATPAAHPRFMAMIGELLAERSGTDRPALGSLGPRPDACPADCCKMGA
jgi:protoporphyrin/coproporphyrin ferrochelatase